MAVNLPVTFNLENFITSWTTISVSERTWHRGVRFRIFVEILRSVEKRNARKCVVLIQVSLAPVSRNVRTSRVNFKVMFRWYFVVIDGRQRVMLVSVYYISSLLTVGHLHRLNHVIHGSVKVCGNSWFFIRILCWALLTVWCIFDIYERFGYVMRFRVQV
jgi:hypothetical protein